MALVVQYDDHSGKVGTAPVRSDSEWSQLLRNVVIYEHDQKESVLLAGRREASAR